MQGPETRLRKKIVVGILAEFPGSYVRKIHGNQFQNIGMSDLHCCIEGYFFAIEIKCPGKKATPAQLMEGLIVLRSKGIFGVVTSPDEALDLIRRGLAWHHKRLHR